MLLFVKKGSGEIHMTNQTRKTVPIKKLTKEEMMNLLEALIRQEVAQECYNQCLAVECGEGEAARAIATKFPTLVSRLRG